MCGTAMGGSEAPEEKKDTEPEAEAMGEDVVICPDLKTDGPRHLALVPICPSCRGRLGGATWSPGYLPRHLG